jgi:hypothetical protein
MVNLISISGSVILIGVGDPETSDHVVAQSRGDPRRLRAILESAGRDFAQRCRTRIPPCDVEASAPLLTTRAPT